jgi:hypothetical protein
VVLGHQRRVNGAVLAHIDYPVRHWPAAAGPFDPAVFEEEYRTVLAAAAGFRAGRDPHDLWRRTG